jgi:hypothetical protein
MTSSHVEADAPIDRGRADPARWRTAATARAAAVGGQRPSDFSSMTPRCRTHAACCPRGHCSELLGDCVQIPGSYGARCDNVSLFDISASLGAPQLATSTIPNVPCAQTSFTARALRSYLQTWLTRVHKPNKTWHSTGVGDSTSKMPLSWKGCFGCEQPHGRRQCCRGRGDCVHGLCACHPGYSGIDCAHEAKAIAHAQEPQARAAARPSSVSIYVYDLPSDLGLAAFAYNAYANRGGETIYLAEWHFLEALLGDASTRTTDPAQADLFFVPLFAVQGVSSNFYCPRGQLELVVGHLQARSSYWRRSQGRDHVFFVSGDKGACGLPPEVASRPIFLSHFGLLGPYDSMPRAAAERRKLDNAERVAREIRGGAWCLAPHKDVVVPPLAPRKPGDAVPQDAEQRPWRYLLVHGGGVYGPGGVRQSRAGWLNSRYSQGIRQELFETYANVSAIDAGAMRISDRRLPEAIFAAAKFCLAPTGEGWGIRLAKSVLSGCVPLISQPLVEQPFEALLDYSTFSRRMAHGEAKDLTRQLSDSTVPPHQLHAMRRALGPVARALEWRPAMGGLAYNLTILALCHRAVELRGALRAHGARCDTLGRALLPLVGLDADGVQARAARGVPPVWHPPALVTATERLIVQRHQAMVRCEKGRADCEADSRQALRLEVAR